MPLNCIPPTDDRAGARGEAAAADGPGSTSTSASGAASSRATARAAAGSPTRACSGFKCFLLALGRRRVPARSSAAELEAHAGPRACSSGLLLVHAEDAGASLRDAARAGPALLATTWRRGRAAPRTPPSHCSSSSARSTGARVHIVHLSRRDALPLIRSAQRRGPADHRRDVPALPLFTRRGDPRRRHPVQVRAADPRGGEPRARCGRRSPTATIDCVVTDHSPCTPELEAARQRRLRRGLGRHRLAAARAARPSGPRPARRGHALDRRRALDGRAARPRLAGLPAQGRDRRRLRRRLRASSTRTTRFVVDPAKLHHQPPGHALRRPALDGRRADDLAARCARSMDDVTARGRLLTARRSLA